MQPLNIVPIMRSNKRMSSSNPLPQIPAKKIAKEKSPMLLKIETAEQKQMEEITKKIKQVNHQLVKALKVQNFIMNTNEQNKRNYESTTNSRIMEFKYPSKDLSPENEPFPNHHYCIEDNNEIIDFIDYDDKVSVTLLKKNNTENGANVVTLHKNDPNIIFTYKDEDTSIVKYTNYLQDITIQKDLFYYNYDSKAQRTYKDFHTKIDNKDIHLSHQCVRNSSNISNNIFYNYTEQDGEQTKGYFINDKMNGDGHTGVIAFTPKEI